MYEVNGISGLNNKVVWIEPTETAGEWRTRFRRKPSGSCTVCIRCVDYCTGLVVNGAAVTVTQGGATIGTCTTSVLGIGCVTLPGPGTYTFSVAGSASYKAPLPQTVSVACGATVTFDVVPVAQLNLTYTVFGCSTEDSSSPLPGATLSAPGVTSCTTNSSGQCTISYPGPGTYTLTASDPRYTSVSQTVTISSCTMTGTNFTLYPESGYTCCEACHEPVATTLTLADAQYGTATLTYSGGLWVGTIASATNCWNGRPMTITYTFNCSSSNSLAITWTYTDNTGGGGACSNCCHPPTGGVTVCPETGAFMASYQAGSTLAASGGCGEIDATGFHGGIYCNYPSAITITE